MEQRSAAYWDAYQFPSYVDLVITQEHIDKAVKRVYLDAPRGARSANCPITQALDSLFPGAGFLTGSGAICERDTVNTYYGGGDARRVITVFDSDLPSAMTLKPQTVRIVHHRVAITPTGKEMLR